jgi:hypothetical protein
MKCTYKQVTLINFKYFMTDNALAIHYENKTNKCI